LSSTFEGGYVVCAGDEGGVEDVARSEELVHPGAAGKGGHDVSDIELAFVVSRKRSLLGLADVLSVGAVVGHFVTTGRKTSSTIRNPSRDWAQ